MRCKAIQYSDEMHCAKCNLRWDTNDPEPPPCKQDDEALPPSIHNNRNYRQK